MCVRVCVLRRTRRETSRIELPTFARIQRQYRRFLGLHLRGKYRKTARAMKLTSAVRASRINRCETVHLAEMYHARVIGKLLIRP